jgi:fatty acid desaturase
MPAHLLTHEKVRLLVTVPTVALPTVLLTVVCFIVVAGAISSLQMGFISPCVCLVINVIFMYASFTPLHDATHGNVAKQQYRWLNDCIGMICGFLLCLPYTSFRYLHLEHHQHTNDKEKDPDAWNSCGPKLLLPLRWMTVELYHYIRCLQVFHTRPAKERVAGLGQLVMHLSLAGYCTYHGYTTSLLYGWVLPGRIAIFFLAYVFDYLPHRPHSHTRSENEYLASCVVALWPSKSSVSLSLLTWPFLHQNYHVIHHLVPYIPFYMYETVWLGYKDELEKEGIETIALFGSMKKTK